VRKLLSIVLLALALGCGNDPSPGPDAGPPPVDAATADAPIAVDSGRSEDDGGALLPDSGAPLDAAPDGAAAETASVAWITEVEPITLDSDTGLDWLFQYEVMIEGDPFVYSLTVERCIEIAGHEEACETQTLDALDGTSGIRFGIDPSMYAVGETHYRFHLRLERGGEPVDDALLDVEVNVTRCTECVDS
jgi:hypothetical protein